MMEVGGGGGPKEGKEMAKYEEKPIEMGEEPPQGRRQTPLWREGAPTAERRPIEMGATVEY
jgi:hypothetical protein